MHFLLLKNVHRAVCYYFHWALGFFTLLCNQQLIWWSLFRASCLGPAVPCSPASNKRGPEESPELQAAELLLLKPENWFEQIAHRQYGSASSMRHLLPLLSCSETSAALTVMLPQPQKKAAFPDSNYESLYWGILHEALSEWSVTAAGMVLRTNTPCCCFLLPKSLYNATW